MHFAIEESVIEQTNQPMKNGKEKKANHTGRQTLQDAAGKAAGYVKQEILFFQNSQTRRSLASVFGSVEELDANHKLQVNHLFDATAFRKDKKVRLKRLLNIIKTFSVNAKEGIIGVCFLSIRHMMEVYQERHNEKISERSVQYLLRDLEALAFVQTVATLRKSDHRQSTNIYRTMRMSTDKRGEKSALSRSEAPERSENSKTGTNGSDNTKGANIGSGGLVGVNEGCNGKAVGECKQFAPKEEKSLHPKKALSFSKAQTKDSKKRITKSRSLNFVPTFFQKLTSVFNEHDSFTVELFRVAKHVGIKTYELEREAFEMCATQAITHLKAAIKQHNQGKRTIKNPFGYFHAIMETVVYEHEMSKMHCHIQENIDSLGDHWLTW